MISRKLLLNIVLITALTATSLLAEKDANITDIYSQAIKAFQEEEYLKAIALWEEILEKDPDQVPPKKMIELAKQKIHEMEAPLTGEARELARQGKYSKAKEKYMKVLAMNPNRKEIIDELERAKKLIKFFDELTDDGKVPRLIRVAAGRYIIEYDAKSVLELLIYAEQINKDDNIAPPLAGFLDMVKKEFPKTMSEIKIVEGFSLHEQYLEESLSMMYDTNYVGTIDKCKRILIMEPDDITALMRIGSSYYALNKTSSAEKFWKKVLDIEPGNKQVKKFLKVLNKVKKD